MKSFANMMTALCIVKPSRNSLKRISRHERFWAVSASSRCLCKSGSSNSCALRAWDLICQSLRIPPSWPAKHDGRSFAGRGSREKRNEMVQLDF